MRMPTRFAAEAFGCQGSYAFSLTRESIPKPQHLLVIPVIQPNIQQPFITHFYTRDMVVREDIRTQLSRLVDSDRFRSSPSVARLLVFCVDTMLAGEEESLKETTIGVACFGRSPGYDPKIDPIVRVSARRLRGKLDLFYETEGKEDAIRINLPKGGYVPQFEQRFEQPDVDPLPLTAEPIPELPAPVFTGQPSWQRQFLRIALMLFAVVLATASVTFFVLTQKTGTAAASSKTSPTLASTPSSPQLLPANDHAPLTTAGPVAKVHHGKRKSSQLQPVQTRIQPAPPNGLRSSPELSRPPVLEAASYALPGSFEPRL
jgi:hypothetical protein